MSPRPAVPATVADLELAIAVEVLARHACNVTDAARDLGVPPSDLRRLLWANPKQRRANGARQRRTPDGMQKHRPAASDMKASTRL
jgi:hypothetical protein